MTSSVSHTTVDCADAHALSRWWQAVQDYSEEPDDPNEPGHEECMIYSADGHELAKRGEVAFDFGEFWFRGQKMGSGQCPVKRYTRQLRDLIADGSPSRTTSRVSAGHGPIPGR
jgi:hypothetical protein